MKTRLILLLMFLQTASVSFAQLLNEGFELYNSATDFTSRWEVDANVSIDTFLVRSGDKSLIINESITLIYLVPLAKPGKLEFSAATKGTGTWNIEIETSTNANFSDPNVWQGIETFTTDLLDNDTDRFTTKTADINALGRVFLKLKIEKIGNNARLFLDDIILHPISREAEEVIKSKMEEERLKAQREADFKKLLASANYQDAARVVQGYQRSYQSRIKTLSMLYDKSNIVKIVSGTASALGDLNQLSNPLMYEKFNKINSELLPKLDPIERLHYGDQITGKLNNFFRKIENPLNFVLGVGDVVTGGGIGVIVDSFKDMITKAFNQDRLKGLRFRGDDLKEEQKKGMSLYKESQVFLGVIQEQNQKAVSLNEKIFQIYQGSKELNSKISQLYIEYLRLVKVETNETEIIELVKNQEYGRFNSEIDGFFGEVLGGRQKFDQNRISAQAKEIDAYFQRIDNYISEYDRLSNKLNSFFSDFKSSIDTECPFADISERDRQLWDRETNKILNTIQDVEKSFNVSYTNVNFKR